LLLQCSQVAHLPQPENYQLRFFRDWLQGEREGNNFFLDGDVEWLTWNERNDDDFITLAEARTWINPWIQDKGHDVKAWWQRLRGIRSKRPLAPTDAQLGRDLGRTDNLDAYTFAKVSRRGWLGLLTIIMALVPILIVLWLDHVHATRARINIAIGSTLVVGLLMFLITANPKEVFGATAA
jgi:hypothetical protein